MKNQTRLAISGIFAGILAMTASTASAVNCPGPDAFGIKCIDNPATCTQIATTSTDFIATDDSCVVRPIGFTFKYYGVNYTQVGVSDNGYVQMGGCITTSDFSNDCPVPNTLTPNQAVHGLWDDLNGGNAAAVVTDGLSGTSPNRIYTVNYVGMPHFSFGGSAALQIQLHENNSAGEMSRVRIAQAPTTTGWSFTTGTENVGGTDGLLKQCNVTVTAPQCTEFSLGTVTPPSTTCASQVSVDKLETKLDDGTRFTSDAEQAAQTTAITSRLDDGSRFTSDAERNTLAAQLGVVIAAIEAKLDRMDEKLVYNREVEQNLNDHACLPNMYTPKANGGRAEDVLAHLQQIINSATELGCPDAGKLAKAQCYLDAATAKLSTIPYDCGEFCHLIRSAYDNATPAFGGLGSCD